MGKFPDNNESDPDLFQEKRPDGRQFVEIEFPDIFCNKMKKGRYKIPQRLK
jgi:hypothetical protein